MNKFMVFSCIRVNENDYEGPCVVMSCLSDPSFMLFFPVSEDNAKVISYILEGNDDYDIDTNVLGLYQTMINTWRSSDRYLSGILMDSTCDKQYEEEILLIRLALSDREGSLDSLVRVNFLHAILLAAMEQVHVIVSDELIAKMLPSPDDMDDELFDMEDHENIEDVEEFDNNIFRDTEKNQSKSRKKRSISRNKDGIEDQNIVEIARKIMSGKIKEKENESEGESDCSDNEEDK
jgi:hypothetical protein